MKDPTIFQNQLRAVLNHLYDYNLLWQSPLVDTFNLRNRSDAAQALQRIIIQGIDGLKPGPDEPNISEKRLIYDILVYRYLEQFKQVEVGHLIGVSIRQFRREQDRAVEALMYSLLERHNLVELCADSMLLKEKEASENPAKDFEMSQEKDAAEEDTQGTKKLKEDEVSQSEDWKWILNSPGDWVTGTHTVTKETLELIHPVAAELGVRIQTSLPETLPDLAVHPVAFRQMLLNITRKALDHASSGMVKIQCVAEPPSVFFRFYLFGAAKLVDTKKQGIIHQPNLESVETTSENNLLKIASELARISKGNLEIRSNPLRWEAELSLPMIDGLPVIVVDDNREIIALLERYTAGTRYRVQGVDDPEKAIELARSSGARIAVLDVMMPHIDGWELLSRFRKHPDTEHIPVIILTILAQQDLALALGARILVQKPILQDVFLSALDQLAAELH